MRIATWNIEWANALFDDAGMLLADGGPSARYRTTRAEQIAGITQVLTRIDADAIMVIEAPDTGSKRSTVTALENLAAHAQLRARRAMIGFPSGTEQEIAFLYDPDRITAHHVPGEAAGFPRFDGHIVTPHGHVTHSKPPLELQVRVGKRELHLIGVHAKSKAPHGADDAAHAIRIGRDNRRKQLAQCRWIRGRVDGLLADGAEVIVLGDFNDGPGLDEYETEFGQSGVEVVLGDGTGALTDPHARMALSRRMGLVPTSARFWLAPEQRYFEALLDFIMISNGLNVMKPRWNIWHPFNDPACAPLRDALLAASDHFPVTLDLDLAN
ncbi:MAG: endonuclease/exonuclease/phosphatase family protein [Paracoccaceae bacterium]